MILRLLYGVRYTDMCPFRAIRREALAKLNMREETYGWNLEMQMKAARCGLRVLEIPVDHRRRVGGESKVSGTLRGTFVAGSRIIATLDCVENVRVACELNVAEGVPRLKLPEGARLISVMRNGQAEIAVGATELEAGDQVLAILEPGKEDELRRVLLKR